MSPRAPGTPFSDLTVGGWAKAASRASTGYA